MRRRYLAADFVMTVGYAIRNGRANNQSSASAVDVFTAPKPGQGHMSASQEALQRRGQGCNERPPHGRNFCYPHIPPMLVQF